jgi:hypothetical protein
MAKKSKGKQEKTRKKDGSGPGLWIASRYSLKGPAGERAWENRPGGPPNSEKYLELADIAMGLKKPEPQKRKSARSVAHITSKTEPYSS